MERGHNSRNEPLREVPNHWRNDACRPAKIDLDRLASSLLNALAACCNP